MDMSLKIVARYYGEAIARATARHMKYPFPTAPCRGRANNGAPLKANVGPLRKNRVQFKYGNVCRSSRMAKA